MRVKAWRERMNRLESEINGETPITHEGYVAANMGRADLRVIGVTENQFGPTVLRVQLDDTLSLLIPAYGELMDAKLGDRLRIVFAEDADEWEQR